MVLYNIYSILFETTEIKDREVARKQIVYEFTYKYANLSASSSAYVRKGEPRSIRLIRYSRERVRKAVIL